MKGGKEREHIRGGPDIDEGTLPKHPRAGGKGRASEDERRPREGGQQRDRDWMLSMSAVRLPTRDWYTDVASVLGACCWRRHMLLPMGSAICRGGICVSSTCWYEIAREFARSLALAQRVFLLCPCKHQSWCSDGWCGARLFRAHTCSLASLCRMRLRLAGTLPPPRNRMVANNPRCSVPG